jgi:hypothetical protein
MQVRVGLELQEDDGTVLKRWVRTEPIPDAATFPTGFELVDFIQAKIQSVGFRNALIIISMIASGKYVDGQKDF